MLVVRCSVLVVQPVRATERSKVILVPIKLSEEVMQRKNVSLAETQRSQRESVDFFEKFLETRNFSKTDSSRCHGLRSILSAFALRTALSAVLSARNSAGSLAAGRAHPGPA